jgi:hypothetical protein
VVRADGDHAAELPQVPSDGVDPRGAGLEVPLTQPVQRDHGLLLDRLHRHPAQGLVAGGFEQGLGVGPVGLVAVAIAGHVPRMQERDPMPQLLELAAPVMGRAAGLQQHLGGGVLGKETAESRPGQAPALPHLAGHGGDRDLEDGLGKIDADL